MPTATRTFRVFVSSTFEDLRAERDSLQEKVFPELAKFCSEKGARFPSICAGVCVRKLASIRRRWRFALPKSSAASGPESSPTSLSCWVTAMAGDRSQLGDSAVFKG
jgi:Domain of unknown function (DUF4062)